MFGGEGALNALTTGPNCFNAKAFGTKEARHKLAQLRIIIDYQDATDRRFQALVN